MGLTGHTALVTGANHGIGAAICLALAQQGADVLASYLRVQDPPELDLQQEYRVIINLAARAVSLVEIGACLRVPVGVARVLVSDLAESGYVVVHAPPPSTAAGSPPPDVLHRLLEGLRAR